MKKKEIHVVYVITKLELGGAQKVCLSLLDGLRKSHVDSFLISGTEGTLAPTVEKKEHVFLLDTFKREVSPLWIFKEVKNFFNLIKLIRKLKKTHDNLIIHTHSTKAGLLGRWAGLFARAPYRLHTVHGFGFHPYQSTIAWLINYALELMTSFVTTHYVCVSSYDVQTACKLIPRFKNKHSIIRAAIDDVSFQGAISDKSHNKPFIIGTIACFKKQKNLFDLLKAFQYAYTHNSHLKLEVIGDGNLRPHIETWIKKNQLESAITLHGWVHDVPKKLTSWHAFALSSLWEGLPCAIIEARIAQLPVLAYDTGGIKDVIFENQNGMLFKPSNWQSLGEGIVTLSFDPELYKKLSSHQDDLTDFSKQTMIDQHILLYQQLHK